MQMQAMQTASKSNARTNKSVGKTSRFRLHKKDNTHTRLHQSLTLYMNNILKQLLMSKQTATDE